jgi:hypothetical protein
MTENRVTQDTNARPETFQSFNLNDIVLELYKSYETMFGQNLWPWEFKRWEELVYCLLVEIAGPDMAPEAIRDINQTLANTHLLDIDIIGTLDPVSKPQDANHAVLVTIATILKNSGFSSDEAEIAVQSVCEVATGFLKYYEGKVQNFFRKYGMIMLDDLQQNFSFSKLSDDDIRKVFSIWFQNTLNMPIPTHDHLIEQVCAKIKVEYSDLINAADKLNVNVALLDNVLRAYWLHEIQYEGDVRVV